MDKEQWGITFFFLSDLMLEYEEEMLLYTTVKNMQGYSLGKKNGNL